MEADEEELIKKGDRFCGKPEQQAAAIREFCTRTRALTYPERFVSAAVIRSGEDICSSGAAIYAQSLHSVAVRYAVLKESILPNACTVGNDDLLQLMTDSAKAWKKGANWKFLMRNIRNLVGETIESKRALLWWATGSRGSHDYSEARLDRYIGQCDIELWGGC